MYQLLFKYLLSIFKFIYFMCINVLPKHAVCTPGTYRGVKQASDLSELWVFGFSFLCVSLGVCVTGDQS